MPKSILPALSRSFRPNAQGSKNFESPNGHVPKWGWIGNILPFYFNSHTANKHLFCALFSAMGFFFYNRFLKLSRISDFTFSFTFLLFPTENRWTWLSNFFFLSLSRKSGDTPSNYCRNNQHQYSSKKKKKSPLKETADGRSEVEQKWDLAKIGGEHLFSGTHGALSPTSKTASEGGQIKNLIAPTKIRQNQL